MLLHGYIFTHLGFVLKCLVGWREGRKRYVIASDANSASLTANCFVSLLHVKYYHV